MNPANERFGCEDYRRLTRRRATQVYTDGTVAGGIDTDVDGGQYEETDLNDRPLQRERRLYLGHAFARECSPSSVW